MNDYQVIWRGPVLDATGYGMASREYALSLDRQDVELKIESYTWGFPFTLERDKKERLNRLINKSPATEKEKVLLYHSPPSIIGKKERTNYYRCILNTVWETTKLPANWVPVINTYDAVFVPCTQNIAAMRNSGVNIPAFLVPHGADTKGFNPKNKKLDVSEAKGKFVFVSIFDFQHRKNPETLLRAYWEEFTKDDDVLLVVKTYGNSHKRLIKAMNDYKKRLGLGDTTAPLVVITGICEEEQFKGIYTLGNAFVLPTRGEGVGLPFIEALSSGLPVIATGWGGQMDFLNKHNSFLIDYKLRHPSKSMDSEHAIAAVYRDLFDGEGQLWAEADRKHLRKLMRYAYENPVLCKQKGERGRKDMLKNSWDQAGFTLKQAIEKVLNY